MAPQLNWDRIFTHGVSRKEKIVITNFQLFLFSLLMNIFSRDLRGNTTAARQQLSTSNYYHQEIFFYFDGLFLVNITFTVIQKANQQEKNSFKTQDSTHIQYIRNTIGWESWVRRIIRKVSGKRESTKLPKGKSTKTNPFNCFTEFWHYNRIS